MPMLRKSGEVEKIARKVRKMLLEQPLKAVNTGKEVKYYTAIYARKSKEDKESSNIQISMLEEYVDKSEDLLLYKVFSDNGFTGVNFDRPSYLKMIEEMRLGKFNAIVVKDSSRLGRNYLEAGAYIETEFPKYGIRFISVNDRYDSANTECINDGISLPLKNILNEQYSKDLSRKLSPVFRIRQMDGKFIGAFAPYGYLKDKNDRNLLVEDPKTAPIVRRIFQSKIKDMSDGAIAKELNGEGILSPFAYRYKMGIVKADKYRDLAWKRGTIAQIIVNPIYLGNMVQGKIRQSLSLHESKHRTPQNEWIVVKNTHEAVVDKELFEKVQLIISTRKEKYHQLNSKCNLPTINLIKGKIFCGDCGRAMELSKSNSAVATNRYYRCKLYNETAGDRCSIKTVKKEMIESLVLEVIRKNMKLYYDTDVLIELNREMVETFISRIEIINATRITIKLNCADEIEIFAK